MSWNNNLKSFEASSQQDLEARLIDKWNEITGGDITTDNYSGTGLQAVFYTFIQALTTTEGDIVTLQSYISGALRELNQKVLRPPVVLDKCRELIQQLELNVTVFDTNFSKLSTQPTGYYLVSKGEVNNIVALEELFKKTVVAGVKTFGTTNLDTQLSNGEPIQYKYTIGTQLTNIKIKIRFTRLSKVEPFISFSENIKNRLVEDYFANFTVANDINPFEIAEAIKDLTTDCSYGEYSYSLDNGTTYNEGYYSIPFDKFISIIQDDIIIEEI